MGDGVVAVAVPEALVDKDDCAVLEEDNVRCPRETLIVDTVTEPPDSRGRGGNRSGVECWGIRRMACGNRSGVECWGRLS